MAKTVDQLYWDACIIIDALQKRKDRFHHIEPILKEAESGKLDIIVSVLCFAEVLDINDENDDALDRGEDLIEAFFEHEYVNVYSANESTMRLAGNLRRNFKRLKTADAIHLATAIERGVPIFLTRDGDGKKGAGLLGLDGKINNPSLEIITPETYFTRLSSETRQEVMEEHEQKLKKAEEDKADDE